MISHFRLRKWASSAHRKALAVLARARESGPLPQAVFNDAYIIGFLEGLTLDVVRELKGRAVPQEEKDAIFATVYRKLVPGNAEIILASLDELRTVRHAAHVHYLVGRREAREYVQALAAGDATRGDALHAGFTNFIARNYRGGIAAEKSDELLV